MAMPDVTVMGAGIFGLSVAYACARRGAAVRVIERERIGAGASGGPVGALAPHVPEAWNAKKAFQLESLLMGPAHWAEVDARSGLSSGYARRGRVQPIAAEAVPLARSRAESAAQLWQGKAAWSVEANCDAEWCLPRGDYLIRDTLSARIEPMGACLSLAWAVRALGGAIDVGADGPASGAVVWATGAAGLEALSQGRARPVGSAVKGQAVALRLAVPEWPQVFADGLHIVPHANGTVAVGSTTERIFADPRSIDAQAEDLVRRAVRICPELAGADVVWRWAGLRPRARSRAPMLGPWPDRKGHYLANGGFKIGLGLAPLVGEVMADLVLKGRDRVPDGLRVENCL